MIIVICVIVSITVMMTKHATYILINCGFAVLILLEKNVLSFKNVSVMNLMIVKLLYVLIIAMIVNHVTIVLLLILELLY